ncbi:uncharacterized protein Dwil_GK10960 [Drosophila willistoni]|uniref:Uncharacterized protein n=1 Tax=Drosophila willistoni TaxID=7260 RepID=B4N8V3_DROWI|nr:uncharacterized protein LOC6647769 [Drosophila willistoni]EDW81554.1 uncharacterized protein Dwil_GK10960 [Drosophila willistoni]
MDRRILILVSGTLLSLISAQSPDITETPLPKPGRYVPSLYGASGLYMPDNSGKYQHQHRPYDGGYGDRGQPYASDLRGIFRQAEDQLRASLDQANEEFALGPKDHLRFMIDFNYNGTGWQIIQFDWVRDGDGDDQKKYNYVNENKLWETENQAHEPPEQAYVYEKSETEPQSGSTDAICDPVEIQQVEEVVEEPRANLNSQQDPRQIQETINEVLEYIQQRILPTLNR